MSFFGTMSGRRIYYERPDPEAFDIEEMAHCLSQVNRFVGHVRSPYTVAQHSCCVVRLLPEQYRLEGLLHDGHEMLTNDIPRPLKELLGPELNVIIRKLDAAIFERFGVISTLDSRLSIKAADDMMLAIEYRDLHPHGNYWAKQAGLPEPYSSRPLNPLGWEDAKRMFLETFEEVRN